MADLLTATSVDDEQKSYVEAIRESGQSLGSLIDDLLDLSRIEAGKLNILNERFAVAPLVESVVELLAPRAHGKGLEIASFVAPDVPGVTVGDAARLRQVLLNLAGNAVKFTERGGVGLRVVREARTLMVRSPIRDPACRSTDVRRYFKISSRATRRLRASMAEPDWGLPSRNVLSSEWMAGCGSPIHLKPGARLSFRCRSRPVRNTPSRNATCWGKLSLLLLRRSSKLPISVKGLPPGARLLSVPG
jgi:hypothetical protein